MDPKKTAESGIPVRGPRLAEVAASIEPHELRIRHLGGRVTCRSAVVIEASECDGTSVSISHFPGAAGR